jgi:hypothetical protein
MAKGVVTTDDTQFRRLVERYPPAVRELAWAARTLIRDVLPRVVEVVWHDQGTAGYGTGPRKMTEHFCWIAPYQGHVVLGFYYGTELPAPDGLLEGTGRLMRHVKVRSLADLERPEVRRLVELATTHRVPALPPDTAGAQDPARAGVDPAQDTRGLNR